MVVTVVIGGAQPSTLSNDSSVAHGLDLWPYTQVAKDLWAVEAAGTVRDELYTSPRICWNPVRIQQWGTHTHLLYLSESLARISASGLYSSTIARCGMMYVVLVFCT